NHGDVTNFLLDKTFAMIIIPWSFKYLLSTNDQLACLEQARRHLADDGAFILDLYPREIIEKVGTETQTVEVEGTTITKTYTYSTDILAQIRYTDAVVDMVHSEGKAERVQTKTAVSLIMPRETELLVRAAGFEIAEDYGGNDFSEYTHDDWKRVLVLKKKKSFHDNGNEN
ncbi:MAG: hypothetical protein ACW960_11645, partial [Candidatus Thorarchaeota archaeon]